MKIIESHNYLSWTTLNCNSILSKKFIRSVYQQQAHSISQTENRRQYKVEVLWKAMCSGNLDYEPKDAAIIARIEEMGVSFLDVNFDKGAKY